jgi:CRISPR type III-A-associated protein Csm2
MTPLSDMKKCDSCGKMFKTNNPKFTTCYDCSQKRQSTRDQALRLPAGYLKNGYFDSKGYVFKEVIINWPNELAKSLGAGGVTTTGLRRFYTKAKYAEQRLDHGEPFESIVATLYEMEQHAVNAVGKAVNASEKKGFELFKQVIETNVELAVKNRDAFKKGFLLHFQGLIAYFKYHNPSKK